MQRMNDAAVDYLRRHNLVVNLFEEATRARAEEKRLNGDNARLKAENEALRFALHEAVLQVIRDAMPRKEGEE